MRVVAFTRRTAPLPFPPTNARASSCALVSSSSPSIIVPHYDTIYTTIRVHNTKKHTHTHTHTHTPRPRARDRGRAPRIVGMRASAESIRGRVRDVRSIHPPHPRPSIDRFDPTIHPSIHPTTTTTTTTTTTRRRTRRSIIDPRRHPSTPPPSWCGRAVIGDSSHDSSNVRASASSRTSGRSDSGGRVVLFV